MAGTRQNLEKAGCDTSGRVGEDQIQNVKAVCDLGYHLHCKLKITLHVNKLSTSLYVTLCKNSQIRHYFDTETTKMMVQSLVLSRLDYCNSLLLGILDQNLKNFKRYKTLHAGSSIDSKSVTVTPHFINLHWLKIQEKIIYKTATFVYVHTWSASCKSQNIDSCQVLLQHEGSQSLE